jgi:hypothetical protein
MKRNNHSVNVGEGVDSDSTISLMIVTSCVSGRGQASDIPDDGAALEHS